MLVEEESECKGSLKKERGEGQTEPATVYQLQQKIYVSLPHFYVRRFAQLRAVLD